MATILHGILNWQLTRDTEGHRNYDIDFLVEASSKLVGPGQVLLTPGLPLPGSFWAYSADVDVYARRRMETTVQRYGSPTGGEPWVWWQVGCRFSTKSEKRNNEGGLGDKGQGDPLDIKFHISGSTTKYQEEATFDKDNAPIKSSSLEYLKGPAVEFDKSRSVVTIEQKRASLELALCESMRDKVNDLPLWGFPKRAVKLTDFTWEILYYQDRYKYFTRKFTFEIRTQINTGNAPAGVPLPSLTDPTGATIGAWDKVVADEGRKVLRGAWDRAAPSLTYRKWVTKPGMDPTKPNDFQEFKDWDDNLSSTLLNGAGVPWDPTVDLLAGVVRIKKYLEGNFLLLNIPTSLE